jgi:hypothetical protein
MGVFLISSAKEHDQEADVDNSEVVFLSSLNILERSLWQIFPVTRRYCVCHARETGSLDNEQVHVCSTLHCTGL